MTRLIDADALIENHFSPSHRIALSYADKQWMRKIINEAPTVEAIPIEWILLYIQEYPYMTASSMLHYWSFDQAIERKEE